MSEVTPLTGHCICKALTYTLTATPLVTQYVFASHPSRKEELVNVLSCCHCTYCQRETGTAFAINTVIERYNFSITSKTQPEFVGIPSASSPAGDTHLVAHCPEPSCRTALFAYYGGNKSMVFVKAGTLDNASRQKVKPDAHIFTDTKLDWINLDTERNRGVGIYEGFYKHEDVWSEESLERRVKLRAWWAQQREEGSLG
jgi:hypothetical protein